MSPEAKISVPDGVTQEALEGALSSIGGKVICIEKPKPIPVTVLLTALEKATAWLNTQADRLEKKAKDEQEFRALKRYRKLWHLTGKYYGGY